MIIMELLIQSKEISKCYRKEKCVKHHEVIVSANCFYNIISKKNWNKDGPF